MSYELIVPSKGETEATGFIVAMQKIYRGAVYRAELYRSGWRLLKDGAQLRSWDDAPARILKYAMDAKRFIEDTPS